MDTPEKITPPFQLRDYPDIIDVRSPSEYLLDHIPGAINLPALTDQQRIEIGTLYKHHPFQARRLGATYITQNTHHLLTGPLAQKNRTFAPLLYCWRGGMRSTSIATILRSIGWRTRLIQGGYQTWRQYLIQNLAQILPSYHLITLAGLTGVGKTRLLQHLQKQGAQILDLEALANHRGSLLGLPPGKKQPSQKQFESTLWHTLTQLDPARPIFTEAESNRIGKIHCPPPLWKQLSHSTVIELTLPLHHRATLLAQDYPHFIQHPSTLKTLIQHLRPLRGHAQVDQWLSQIDQQNWPHFLTSILKNHYDLAYRHLNSEKSHYPTPTHTIHIPNLQNFPNIAKQLTHNTTPTH